MSAVSLYFRHYLQLEPDILLPEIFKFCIDSRQVPVREIEGPDHVSRKLHISKIELLLSDPPWFHVPAVEATYDALEVSTDATAETRGTREIGRVECLEERLHRMDRGGKLLGGDIADVNRG